MNRPSRTIHVALTDGARVWVEPDGTLPAFVQTSGAGGPTATAAASRLLTDAVHLAPVIVLDDSNRLHVVGSRGGAPRGGAWTPLGNVADHVRSSIERAVVEHRGPLPAGRPEWYAPGWHDEVERWVDAVLHGTGRRRTGALRTHRIWSISAVLTVPTDCGTLWFKASCEHFGAEAAIAATVARHVPDLAPRVVAVEAERCWLLTEPLSGVSDDGAPTDTDARLAPLWAAAQVDSLGWLDELRAAGAPDRGLGPTLARWREVIETNPEVAALSPDERVRLARAVPVVESRLRELWSCGFPDTLAHGDLHSGNVSDDGTDLRIFDWSDGCITHPFLDGTHLAHWISDADGSEPENRVRSVLAPWREAFPTADFDRAVELAPLADLVFQAVTFDALTRSIEAGTGDFDGVVTMLARKVVDRVGARERSTHG